jgi:adenosylcobinamide kinase/adenosylcobinamide-phosphate guanylyltransferase
MGSLTFILGGARSGKSSFAERLASEKHAAVLYIATAQPLDAEMEARIVMHRKKRPAGWQTLEVPFGIGQAIRSNPPSVDVIILDCLTLLVSNLLLKVSNEVDVRSDLSPGALADNGDEHFLSIPQATNAERRLEVEISPGVEKDAKEAIDQELRELLEAIQSSSADWILVSNEVGMGLVPPYPQGRLYRDLLGSTNQRIASLADRVYFMIAGIPMRLTPEL